MSGSLARRMLAAAVSVTVVAGVAATPAGASRPARPAVSGLSSSRGGTAGGSTITVTGSGFTKVSRVLFGSTRGTGVRTLSSSRLSVVVPRHVRGVVDVRVAAAGGTSAPTVRDRFSYLPGPTLAAMTVRRGPDVGRTRMTITGTGFTAITKVVFGSTVGASLAVASSTRLSVTTPAHAAGTVAVRIVGAYGTSPLVDGDRYTYLDTTAPRAVTGLTIMSTATGLALTWTDPAGPDLAGVVVRRNPGATPPSTAASGTAVANVGAGTTRVVDNGVAQGVRYTYSVFAHDAVPNYAAPATVSAVAPTPPDTTAPEPVAALTATVASPGTAVTLTWTDPADDDFAGVVVRRANGDTAPTSQRDGDSVGVPADPGDSVTDTGLSYGTHYAYAVFARDAASNVSPAATALVTTPAIAPVVGLSAQPSGRSVSLRWTNPTDANFAGTSIRSAPGPRPPASITDGAAVVDGGRPSLRSYLDEYPPGEPTLSYSVFALHADGGYSVATTVTITLPSAPAELDAFYDLTVTNSFIDVGWRYGDNTTAVRVALCWELQLRPSPVVTCRNSLTYPYGDYALYAITGLQPNSRYGILAYTIDSSGRRSATGTSLFVQTLATPSPVRDLVVAPVNDHTVGLEWGSPDSYLYDQFVVRRAVGSTPPSWTTGELVATVPRSRATVVDPHVTASTEYSYSVFSRTDDGSVSDPVSAQVTTPVAGTGWQTAQEIDPPAGGLTSLSCATRDFCAAVDYRGHTVTWNGSQWSPVHREDPARYFLSVSCASVAFCIAVDDELNWVSWDGERWTDHGTVDPSVPAANFVAVSCPTTSFCVAVSGQFAVRFDGTAWSTPTSIDPGQYLSYVSCPVAGRCTAVDGRGRALTLAEDRWSAPTPALTEDPSFSRWRNLVSCASVSFCVAADARGSVAVFDGVWHTPTQIRTGSNFVRRAISCASATSCLYGSQYGGVLVWDGTNWAPAPMLSADRVVTAVLLDCVDDSLCVTADDQGGGRQLTSGRWGEGTVIDPDVGGDLELIDCPSASACIALDADGRTITSSDGVWSRPVTSGLVRPTSLTCASLTFCIAVSSSGTWRYDGTTWSITLPATTGDVSCSSTTFCLFATSTNDSPTVLYRYDSGTWSIVTNFPKAARGIGEVSCATPYCVVFSTSEETREQISYAYDGTSWSDPVPTTTGRPLSELSCPTNTRCVAVGDEGTYLFDGYTWSPSDPKLTYNRYARHVGCFATAFCVAVEADRAAVWRDGKWTRFFIDDNPGPYGGHAISAVTCASATRCTAIDGGRYAFTFVVPPA